MRENFIRNIISSVFVLAGIIFLIVASFITYNEPLKGSTSNSVVLFIGMAVIGLAFIGAGIALIIKSIKKKINEIILGKEGIKKIATVVDYEESLYTVNGRKLFKLLVVTEDGTFYTSEGFNLGRLSYKYKINDNVEVLVHPKDKKVYKVLVLL